uniref:Uncharacterized protein n=1 Tax=Timema bartmani TaxID=61472 RepID=A0A7R9I7W4_9NEOP|nr:unnamed protein product [Timema bartmani]
MTWPQEGKGKTYAMASRRGRTYDVVSGRGRTYDVASGNEGEDVCRGLVKGRMADMASGRGMTYDVASENEGEDVCHGLKKGMSQYALCLMLVQVEKQPEEFDEDDLRVVMEYEEKVKFLMSERERYKKMLDQERIKLTTARDRVELCPLEAAALLNADKPFQRPIRCIQCRPVFFSKKKEFSLHVPSHPPPPVLHVDPKSVRKFNSRLADLYQNKLKVDSAINEELLKMLRARQLCYKRALLDKKEQNYMSMIGEKEGIIENLQDDIQKLQKLSSECRGAYESQVNRDKSLEKNFKKDFPDMPALVLEQLSKMYKKRPKIHQRIQTSVALVSELSRCSVSGEKPIFLLAECLDYLKGLDNLDSFSNASPNTSEEIWAILCRVRRLKVESELKMKALSLEVTEADATVNVFQKKMIKNKEMLTSLQGELRVVRNEKLNLIHNLQIQLVMKQGLVEISIQGSISDFDDAILINRVCIDRMNETIKKAGQRKLRTMHETTNFRRGILCKEWEHKKLRMEIEDLKEHLHTLEGIKVTKDIQMYLRRQAQGLPQDKTTSLEKELQLLREVRMCVHTSCNHLHRHGGS